ncbi:MAG: ABC transporter permease subunit [Proteobacteria bacterium TMED51]|jgi:putative spermidine/putrescine transport system permease protein|nr:ABC transporter permease [Gammaproteobacteria bacterium]RPG02742.1 MAG: ABC transporter permease subunit [Proteobacteria bacterium TMED51]HBP85346.1 ABC transporter permease [Gammaproteobacteria bacterium]|tara:strand:+ start:894 stop:1751 length:858 start_codon:yes stop_codon:yes gene_type:complete
MRRTYRFYAQLGFTLLVCSFLILPVIMSVMAGVTENFFKGISSGVTLRWVVEVWDLYADTIFLSLVIAIACLACTIVLGIPAAYVLSKRQGRVARMIEELLTLPLAIPGLAIALALIITYGGFRDFRSSWVFILVGHVLYTLPFMMRSVLAVLSTADFRSLEEGAASVGAGFWRRFFDIVIPNCRAGIVAGALMVVTLSVGEFNITWMMHTPATKTLPVGLADSYASMRLEIGSAYTVVFLIMIIPLLVALQLYGQPKKKQAENFDDLEHLESRTAKSAHMRSKS